MMITDLVAPEAILPALKVNSKKQALQELAARASVLTGQNERAIFEVLLQREKLGTTAVGYGVAIPHGKLPKLLALQQHLEHRALVLPGQNRRACRQLLQRLLLADDFQRGEYRLGCDQIGNRHWAFRGELDRQGAKWALERERREDEVGGGVKARVPIWGLLLQRMTRANCHGQVPVAYPMEAADHREGPFGRQCGRA